MNKVNTKYLKIAYPALFKRISTFECGDGWFKLLNETAQRIKCIAKAGKFKIEAAQVKEKFGSLRFYLQHLLCINNNTQKTWSDILYDVIYRAEDRSGIICEECGTYGIIKKNKHGYILCLCPKCRKKQTK